jgi:hypothetical protein
VCPLGDLMDLRLHRRRVLRRPRPQSQSSPSRSSCSGSASASRDRFRARSWPTSRRRGSAAAHGGLDQLLGHRFPARACDRRLHPRRRAARALAARAVACLAAGAGALPWRAGCRASSASRLREVGSGHRRDARLEALDFGGEGPASSLHGLAGTAAEWEDTAAWLTRRTGRRARPARPRAERAAACGRVAAAFVADALARSRASACARDPRRPVARWTDRLSSPPPSDPISSRGSSSSRPRPRAKARGRRADSPTTSRVAAAVPIAEAARTFFGGESLRARAWARTSWPLGRPATAFDATCWWRRSRGAARDYWDEWRALAFRRSSSAARRASSRPRKPPRWSALCLSRSCFDPGRATTSTSTRPRLGGRRRGFPRRPQLSARSMRRGRLRAPAAPCETSTISTEDREAGAAPPQLVVAEAGLQVAEPAGRAHARPPRSSPRSRSPGRARAGPEPDHRLPAAADRDGLDASGGRPSRGRRRVEAADDLVPAAAVEADRRQHATGRPWARTASSSGAQSSSGTSGSTKTNASGARRPPTRRARASRPGCPATRRDPLRMRRLPAPEAGRELCEPRYRCRAEGSGRRSRWRSRPRAC